METTAKILAAVLLLNVRFEESGLFIIALICQFAAAVEMEYMTDVLLRLCSVDFQNAFHTFFLQNPVQRGSHKAEIVISGAHDKGRREMICDVFLRL